MTDAGKTRAGEKNGCGCAPSGGVCLPCGEQELPYWCETCNRMVAEKRCPLCGLKARRIRDGAL